MRMNIRMIVAASALVSLGSATMALAWYDRPPAVDAEVTYCVDEPRFCEDGVIESLSGTIADIRIHSDSRLETGVPLRQGGFIPSHYYEVKQGGIDIDPE